MEIIAGILGVLACFVFLMAIIRMLENERKKGKKVDLVTWFVFCGVILVAAAGVLGGIYLIFFH